MATPSRHCTFPPLLPPSCGLNLRRRNLDWQSGNDVWKNGIFLHPRSMTEIVVTRSVGYTANMPRLVAHLLAVIMLLSGSLAAFAHGSENVTRLSPNGTYLQRSTLGDNGNFRTPALHDQSECRSLACHGQNIEPATGFVSLPSVNKLVSHIVAARSPPDGIMLDRELPPPKRIIFD